MFRTLPPRFTPSDLSGWAPGVYRQDIFPAPKPSFLTGVPVFLGYAQQRTKPEVKATTERAQKGSFEEARRLTLWPQFHELFDEPSRDGYLAHAVRGFFENGGLICYVLLLKDGDHPLKELRTGLEAISALDDIDLVCTPDVMRPSADGKEPTQEAIATLQQEVLNHCQRLGDRFAVLDSVYMETADIAPVEQHRRTLSGDYGALYFPWVQIDGKPTYVPACGHVAGIYSRSDQTFGVHKAPANEEMEGVLDLRMNLTDPDQGRLNDLGINCLRAFPGRGIRVWGARTLSTTPEWTYISARRLAITVGRWLERFMPEVAFAPNDIRLWVRIMRELTAFLEGLFRRGALQGRSAEQAFFVKCDGETNPPEVRDAGMVVTEVGLAPVVPGEFIVVRVIHGASGVTITPVS